LPLFAGPALFPVPGEIFFKFRKKKVSRANELRRGVYSLVL
jgi:hypothetical protein